SSPASRARVCRYDSCGPVIGSSPVGQFSGSFSTGSGVIFCPFSNSNSSNFASLPPYPNPRASILVFPGPGRGDTGGNDPRPRVPSATEETMRTFGVEEELLLVDVDTGVPVALADLVTRPEADDGSPDPPGPPPASAGTLPAISAPGGVMSVAVGVRDAPVQTGGDELSDDQPVHEMQREQIETGTTPCESLDELADQLIGRRSVAGQAAHRIGAEVAALATSPLPIQPSVTREDRYEQMTELYAMTAQEQLTCGCHVHVSIESEEEGVAVLDRIRPWLPPLLALTANSPFWQGRDTGYSSYRRQVWGRWPSSGPTELFGSPEGYHAPVDTLLGTGTLIDEGMVYFDARLSRHYPTVEVRVADGCLRVNEGVLRASVLGEGGETAAGEWGLGKPPVPARVETLNLAYWRASRSGLE